LPRRLRRFLGWCVHFYTALGLVAAAGIAVRIVQGGDLAFRHAFVLMLIATLIDATDGTLARWVQIKEAVPGFDGRRLDDLIDFQTYTSLPLLLLWRAEVLPGDLAWVLLVPLLASAYGFCQVAAKTDDGYFLGFPSYWNLVAFYLYMLRPAPWVCVSLLLLLSLLTFVPSRYLYPTQPGRLNRLTNVAGGIWCVLIVLILWDAPLDGSTGRLLSAEAQRQLVLVSLFFPIYYLGVSWALSLRRWLVKRKQVRIAPL
jgi:phosphatidylcholine synthase